MKQLEPAEPRFGEEELAGRESHRHPLRAFLLCRVPAVTLFLAERFSLAMMLCAIPCMPFGWLDLLASVWILAETGTASAASAGRESDPAPDGRIPRKESRWSWGFSPSWGS